METEREFSTAGILTERRHASLSYAMLSAMLFLIKNRKVFDGLKAFRTSLIVKQEEQGSAAVGEAAPPLPFEMDTDTDDEI